MDVMTADASNLKSKFYLNRFRDKIRPCRPLPFLARHHEVRNFPARLGDRRK